MTVKTLNVLDVITRVHNVYLKNVESHVAVIESGAMSESMFIMKELS